MCMYKQIVSSRLKLSLDNQFKIGAALLDFLGILFPIHPPSDDSKGVK